MRLGCLDSTTYLVAGKAKLSPRVAHMIFSATRVAANGQFPSARTAMFSLPQCCVGEKQMCVSSSFHSFFTSFASCLSSYLISSPPSITRTPLFVPIGIKSKAPSVLFGLPALFGPCLDVFWCTLWLSEAPRLDQPSQLYGAVAWQWYPQDCLEPYRFLSETHLGAETTVLCHCTRVLLMKAATAASSVHLLSISRAGSTPSLCQTLSNSFSFLSIPATRYTESPLGNQSDWFDTTFSLLVNAGFGRLVMAQQMV